MKLDLEGFLDVIQQVDTLEGFQSAAEQLRDKLGLMHVVYHWVNSKGERFGVGTYSAEWVDRYLAKDYLRMDPVIFGCFQRFTPVNWKKLDWSSKNAKAFLREAIEFGVGTQGYTIPIRGPNGQFALFTMTDSVDDEAWENFITTHTRNLIILAHEFNKKALEFEAAELASPAPTLSPREVMAMSNLAKGMSRAQAAEAMGISEHTLRVYIEAARHKLGALNTTHAVARALSTGVIIV